MGGMKDKERFSAGLVSKPFWFYEYKTYAEQLNKGYTAEEIKAQALQMNLFPAAKEYRVKEILSCVSRRVMQFEPEWQDLFSFGNGESIWSYAYCEKYCYGPLYRTDHRQSGL